MTELTIPYSFVPCSKLIYIPSWAHMVTHDLPFEESYSGAINLTLKNNGYLCVGSKNHESIVDWCNINDHLIIPGSSIKGMLRNALSIICFGKYTPYDNKHYSFRTLTSDSLYMKKFVKFDSVRAAWLKIEEKDNKYVYKVRLCDCAKAYNKDINKELGTNIKNSQNQTAQDKYENFKEKEKTLNDPIEFYIGSLTHKPQNSKNNIDKQIYLEPNEKTQDYGNKKEKGYLVFCNYRIEDKNPNKNELYDYSYFFFNPEKEITIEDSIFIKFEAAQSNEKVKNLIDYLIQNQNDQLGIPIWTFWNGSKVCEIGLSRMPRLLMDNSIEMLVSQDQHNEDYVFDLPELLFGTIRNGDASNLSLKSRIGFSDFITKTQVKDSSLEQQELVLQTPKTSFEKGYLYGETPSYHDKNTKVAGWKRYKVQKEFAHDTMKHIESKNKNITSLVKFLTQPDTEFKGKILFHNLKKEELGALLYTISFWKDDGCFHMLGHAKPYGAGAVYFDNIKLEFPSYVHESKRISIDDAITAFKNEMDNYYKETIDDSWETSSQILCLKEISKIHYDYVENSKVYNNLDKKEFRDLEDSFQYPISIKNVEKKIPNNINKQTLDKMKDYQKQYEVLKENKEQKTKTTNYEQMQKERGLNDKISNANEFEKVFYDLQKEYLSKNLTKDNEVNELKVLQNKIFDTFELLSKHKDSITRSTLKDIKDFIYKKIGLNNETIYAVCTAISNKKKKDLSFRDKVTKFKENVAKLGLSNNN